MDTRGPLIEAINETNLSGGLGGCKYQGAVGMIVDQILFQRPVKNLETTIKPL